MHLSGAEHSSSQIQTIHQLGRLAALFLNRFAKGFALHDLDTQPPAPSELEEFRISRGRQKRSRQFLSG
jgi:hypothetical protein